MVEIAIKKRLQGTKGDMILDVDLQIKQGSFVSIMGESGSGKTTLLRVLAGLEKAKSKIVVDGNSWDNLLPQKREIGFVFQDYALFENMTVEQNLLFVRDDKNLSKKLLELTELTALATRNVKTLSGGQKQRVSLCRAMMNRPKILLMDEPLSALDEKMRNKLQEEISKLHRDFKTTTLMISHDAKSSYLLSDRILVLDQGKIIKDGSKDEVLKKEQKILYSL